MGILRHIVRDVMKPVLVDVSDKWRSRPPIVLKVEYTDTQFAFKFKAPATSTLDIYDGDGPMTQVAGQDDATVTHTTSYSAAGTYYFYVEGDLEYITGIFFNSTAPFATGSIDRWGELKSLVGITIINHDFEGDIVNLLACSEPISYIFNNNSRIYGDISLFASKTITLFNLGGTSISGDFSLSCTAWPGLCAVAGSLVTFDTIVSWTAGGNFFAQSTGWTSTMVDNCLISLANGGTTGKVINLGGTNAVRTSASDAAFAQLDAVNTLTVNEE